MEIPKINEKIDTGKKGNQSKYFRLTFFLLLIIQNEGKSDKTKVN